MRARGGGVSGVWGLFEESSQGKGWSISHEVVNGMGGVGACDVGV